MDVLVLKIVTCLILTTLCSSQSARERRPLNTRDQEHIKVKGLLGSGDAMRLPDDYTRTITSKTLNYRNLVFSNDMSEIYAGTQRRLLIINPSDLTVRMPIDFSLSCVTSLPGTCYVRLIQPLENDCLYVCHSIPQKCCFARTSDGTVRTCTSVNEAPEDIAQNFTITYLKEEKKFFTGVGVTSASIQSAANFRFDNVTEDCNTVERIVYSGNTGSTWLNVPNFVGEPIEYGDYVYFFFREFASEAINGGRITYSRVGRVCKNDPGGIEFTDLAKEFTTYQKARLDCSLNANPNEYPERTTDDNLRTYDFNEIQGTYYINKTIFAVFTNLRTSIDSSSAVCAYNIDEIDELFNDDQVLGQGDDKDLWTKENRETSAFQCSVKAPSSIYKFLEDYPLVSLQVPNKLDYRDTSFNYLRASDAPLLVLDDVRLSQIVVDNNDVMYLGTERGTVIKAYLSENKNETILESEIDFNIEGLPEAPVLSMLKKDNENVVYIGTANSVYRLSLDFEQPATTTTPSTPTSGTINLLNSQCRSVTTMTPQESCNMTIPVNRTLHLNIQVSANEGVGLNFMNAECNSCMLASFSSTNLSSTCGGEDFATVNLVLVTKTPDDECSCSATFGTRTDNRTFRTSITISNDEILAGGCFDDVQDYDNQIFLYKYNLINWKNEILRKSNATVNTSCNNSCE